MRPRPSDDNVMKTRTITVPPPSYRRLERVTTEIAHGASLAAMSSTAIGSSLRSVREFVISASFRIESKSKFRHGVGPMRVGPTIYLPRKKIVQGQFVRNGGHERTESPGARFQIVMQPATMPVALRASTPLIRTTHWWDGR